MTYTPQRPRIVKCVRRTILLQVPPVKANFNPSQPRVPAGNSDGGQWSDGGGSREGISAASQRLRRQHGLGPNPKPLTTTRRKPAAPGARVVYVSYTNRESQTPNSSSTWYDRARTFIEENPAEAAALAISLVPVGRAAVLAAKPLVRIIR